MLRVSGLKKYFPLRKGLFQRVAAWLKAVDGVDFELAEGSTLGLVGESGCGKSTVARLVLKLLEPDAGSIVFRGKDISGLGPGEMKPLRREMQVIFQDPFGSLNPRMTVGQCIREGLRTLGRNAAADRARTGELLEMVGISSAAAERYPHEFSGGQRQRIGIARALSVEPSLIVCDEPVSALDVSIQAQIINLLNDLQEQLGLSYIFIAHDLNVVGYMSDEVAVMYLGHIMEYAATDELFENPMHPYTLALLSAVPEVGPEGRKERVPLTGEVPSPVDPPPGCRFQGRCAHADDECKSRDIELRDSGDGHLIRCSQIRTIKNG